MHEYSLIRSLLRQVDAVAKDAGGGVVLSIELEIGSLAGVEPVLLQEAFEQLQESSPGVVTQLVIHEVGIEITCKDCGQESTIEGFVFRCAECDSGNVRVRRGDQVRLLSISVEDPEHAY